MTGPIDLTHQDAVLLDGATLPVMLIRSLLKARSLPVLVRLEYDDATVDELDIHPEGSAVHVRRIPRQATPATDSRPVETEARAQLVNPSDRSARRWVTRGDEEERQLRSSGWTETGLTRQRVVQGPPSDRPAAEPPGGRR